METIAADRGQRVARLGALAARLLVQTSIVAAVATGCWLLQKASPTMAAITGGLFVSLFLIARWRVGVATAVVLVFAYVNTGLVLLLLPSFAAASLWLAALAGLVAGGCAWTEWRAPSAFRWGLMLWLLGVALSWPIIAGREADFSAVTRGDGVGLVVINALITLCTGVWLDGALSWNLKTIERRVAWPLLASVVIAAAAVFYQALVDITWLSSAIWIGLGRAPGLMGDANPMAVAAAIWAPLAPLVVRTGRGAVIGVLLAFVLWSAAWFTGARTVIVLIAVGAIGLVAGAVAERTTPRRAASVAVVGAFAALLMVAALSRLDAGGPIGRLVSTLPLDRPVDLAYEVLWRRDGYGIAAAHAIREHPWSGVGTGAFYVVSSYFYRLEGGPIVPPDNAQNLWRHLLAERGLLAFPAVIALTVATLRLLWRRAENVPLAYAWTLKAITIGLGLVLLFGYPVQNPAIALTAAALIAWLHAAVAPARSPGPGRLSPLSIALVWLLALLGTAIDARHARGDLRPPWRAARIGDPYLQGFGDVEVGPRAATGRIVRDHAVVALRATGPRYELRCWVRGRDARHVRMWLNRRLIMDELLPAGVVIERLLDTPAETGVLLEFETSEPGIVVSGEFVR